MILGTQEEGVTRMKCVLLIGNNVLIIHRELHPFTQLHPKMTDSSVPSNPVTCVEHNNGRLIAMCD